MTTLSTQPATPTISTLNLDTPTRRTRTRQVTLHRLLAEATLHDSLSYLTDAALILPELEPELTVINGREALFLHAPALSRVPDWCVDASRTTGIAVHYETTDAGALLFIDVDGRVYSVAYGVGHYWLSDHAKDPRFGLAVALRGIDADQIKGLVRQLPGQRGRTDSTLIASGVSIWHLGLERQCDVIRRIGGNGLDLDLTCSRGGDRPVALSGSDGLTVRLGTAPVDFVRDIRELASVASRENPHPDLAFAENITPVTSNEFLDELDGALDEHLADEHAESSAALSLSVPEAAREHLAATRLFQYRVGSVTRSTGDLQLEDLVQRARVQRAGHRVSALRNGRVELHGDTLSMTLMLHRSAAIKWLEATGSIHERRFFLLEGQWYEIATCYVEEVRDYVTRLLNRPAPLSKLPAWQPGQEEKDYNLHVADVRPEYVCLDRQGVTTRLQKPNGVEICDLLGPDDELIHVKRARNSAPLSHLFAQGMVSFHTLYHAAEARKKFARLVAERGRGRGIPEDFVPKKVVFAILLKAGEQVTVETLFPFSQVMLRQTALYLQGKAEVEVVAIPMAAGGVSA